MSKLGIISALGLIAATVIYMNLDTVTAQEAAPAEHAMPVEAVRVSLQQKQVWKNFSARVVAVDQAEIRPQITGIITEILFEDGQHVDKGQLLLVIDPRPYEAELSKANASLASAETQLSLAEKEFNRAKKLIKTNAVSQSVLDERSNSVAIAKAAKQQALALVEAAEVNLDYANIKAPISGKVSRAEITVGNLVQSGQNAPILTTIVADKNMYVDFDMDDQTYLALVHSNNIGNNNTSLPVKVDAGYNTTLDGYIQSFDNHINPTTGTIRARALLENNSELLLPGMSVGVRVGKSDENSNIFISERAIGTDQDRKFVYVINDENRAIYREVTLGQSVDGQRIILSGLSENEKVITSGIARIRPNALVTASIAEPAPAIPAITKLEPDAPKTISVVE